MRPHLGTTRFLLGEGGGVHLFTELRMGTTDDESYFIFFVYATFITFLPNGFVVKFDPNYFHSIRILLGGLDIIYVTPGSVHDTVFTISCSAVVRRDCHRSPL